jgi:hypothetical protein
MILSCNLLTEYEHNFVFAAFIPIQIGGSVVG